MARFTPKKKHSGRAHRKEKKTDPYILTYNLVTEAVPKFLANKNRFNPMVHDQ